MSKTSSARICQIVGFIICVAPVAVQSRAYGQACGEQFCQFNQGDYVVQNDKWGMNADPNGSQKIWPDGDGWYATVNWAFTNRSVKSYPSIVAGWNFGANWTPKRDGFPVLVSSNPSLPTSTTWETTGTFNHYDVAYDLFLSPDNNPQKPSAEVMVWIGQAGQRPAGDQVATAVRIDGVPGTWDVWVGDVGWKVYSFVRTSSVNSFSGNLQPFIHYLAYTHDYLSKDWYVLDMQFGAEILEANGKFINKSFYGRANGGLPLAVSTP